jgi:hypothetical protein
MNAYFDSRTAGNCSHISSVVFDHIPYRELQAAGFNLSYDREYTRGIYIIFLKEYSPNWCGKCNHPRHILYEIPNDVILAARQGKIIIVMDNQAEGFPLVYQGCDGFELTHTTMHNLKLPQYSVVLFDGNQKFNDLYHRWCIDAKSIPMIAHVPAFTHTFYFSNLPTHSLVSDAIENIESKDFLSLNRTMRYHRTDHLAQIIIDGIHNKGLVSGYYSNDPDNPNKMLPKQLYSNMPEKLYQLVLKRFLPLTVDGCYEELTSSPDTNPETIFNHSIYKNSLLSFVTETAFHFPGLFLTEKIMKPIAAGHPFIILGQYRALEGLEKMGYRTDFEGIDQSYDIIEDPIERFAAAHRSLKKWTRLGRSEQIECIMKSMPAIDHNRIHFAQQDYVKQSYDALFEKCTSIFKKYI